MSHTPRHPRYPGRHGSPPPRTRQAANATDPAAGLRNLVEEGIVTAAAMNARDDLELAAGSTQRLGALSSGMWRALGRELATAAERLDRSTLDRIDDIGRRARALQVDPDEVVAAGFAAAHLAEHRDTLETLVKPGQDAHRLLGPNMLFAFRVEASLAEDDDDDDEDEDELEDDDDDDDDVLSPATIEVALFLWPTPLTPAIVSIAPALMPGARADALEPKDVSLGLALTAPPLLLAALTTATELSTEQVTQALTALAIACWSAHQFDEEPLDDEDDETDDDVGDDDGPVGLGGL